jgi:hypothetical protein
MKKIVWIIKVEVLTTEGTKPLEAIKVFESAEEASRYQDNINNDSLYNKMNAFAFCEPAIFIESSE